MMITWMALAGCSGSGRGTSAGAGGQQETADTQENGGDTIKDDQLYILLYSNGDTQRVFLESVETGRQEEFEYHGGTYVKDRYGAGTTMEQLQVGELVYISYTKKKVLTELKVSEDTFVYDGITNFSVDSKKAILMVAGSNYYYGENMKVFSEKGIISLNELSETSDTICIRGQDKEILTLVVTKGHGTVTLKNTELFEGGMITIGNVAAREITRDLSMEIPEGTYTLSAANDGYGGSMEITVKRLEELTLDLNALKGDGPSYGIVNFTTKPEDVAVTVNGKEVDCKKPLELRYGAYRLTAEAEGYEKWGGTLVVSSAQADISIDLESESKTAEKKEDTAKKEDTPEKEDTAKKEDTPEKEGTAKKEDTPKKEGAAKKEDTKAD